MSWAALAGWRAQVLLVALLALVLLPGISRGSFQNDDESVAAAVMREIARGEHPLDIGLLGAIENARPMPFYWLEAGMIRLVGPNELALRLWPTLATIACVLAVFGVLRRLSPQAAWLGAVLYASLHLPVRLSRRPTEDAVLAAVLAFALVAYLDTRERPRAWLRWGLLAGLAICAKGAVGALVFATVALDVCIQRRHVIATRWPWLGGLVALAVAAPFHAMQTVRHGASFWQDYVVHNVADRSSTTLVARTDGFYYLRELLTHDPVLGPLVLAGAAYGAWVLRRQRQAAITLGVSALVPVLAFSAIQTRLSHYMLPAYAPVACLAGVGLASLVQSPRVGRLLVGLVATMGLSFRMPDLIAPDYSQGLKALALALDARLPRGETAYAFDVYHPAVAFYSGRNTVLLTVSRSFHRDLVAAPLLGRSRNVRLVDRRALAEIFSRRSCAIAPADRVPILLRELAHARPGTLPEVLAAGAHVLVCTEDGGS